MLTKPVPLGLLIVVGLLSVIPLWLIPVAPLTDWPTHLAISSLIHNLEVNPLANHFYYLDFSFLGYSLVHLLLAFLQSFVSYQTAGQIVLSLVYVLSPLGWWGFFRLMDPSKQSWAVFGLVFNYSTFFYFGNINFLISIPFGLVFLACGLRAVFQKREHPILFVITGVITYLFHAYVFILLAVLLGGVYFYRRMVLGHPAGRWMIPLLACLLILAILNLATNPTVPVDQTYFSNLSFCANKAISDQSEYNPKSFISEWLSGSMRALRFIEPLYSVWPVPNILLMALLSLSVFAVYLLHDFMASGRPIPQSLSVYLPKIEIGWDKFYLVLAAILYLHLLMVPDCAAWLCNLGQRSIPFCFALVLLAIRAPKLVAPFSWLMLLMVVINIFFQISVFAHAAPMQASILQSMHVMASALPPNATLFVVPSYWTSLYNYSFAPPYSNLYYQSLLVDERPDIYIAGLYSPQQTFILRSHFPIFDDMVHFGPHPYLLKVHPYECYRWPPSEYQFVIDENMTLMRNPNAVQSAKN